VRPGCAGAGAGALAGDARLIDFACSAGACADAGGNFSGTVDAGGAFTGSFKACLGCSAMPVSGTLAPSGDFVLSGSSGGGSSVTITAHRS
jgi:hypothetical protein